MPESKFVPTGNKELYFGLCGALGSNLTHVADDLARQLTRMNYTTHVIRISRLVEDIAESLSDFNDLAKPVDETEDQRLNRAMQIGNRFRQKLGMAYAMVLPAIANIQKIRAVAQDGSKGESRSKVAYIIQSIKRPGEIEFLRAIYRSNFFAISVYSPYEKRLAELAFSIRRSRHAFNPEQSDKVAIDLIDRDRSEDAIEYGQNLRDSFPLADVIIDQSEDSKTEAQVQRFVDIIFGHPFHTPNQNEMGMFHAFGAGLRSSDLSRQVGAVILGAKGEILSCGCNEVPEAGGGSFWPGTDRKDDNRDHKKGHDTTAHAKMEMLEEVFGRMRETGMLADAAKSKKDSELARDALTGGGAFLKGTRAASIIEFGRAVHAEMNAISEAARCGVGIDGARLFTTTFPCHMCARHIIASGICEVVYNEPYPKSMTQQLYPDDVVVDGEKPLANEGRGVVCFTPFVGVTPRRFIELFQGNERKDKQGYAVSWKPAEARLRSELPINSDDEEKALASLKKGIDALPRN